MSNSLIDFDILHLSLDSLAETYTLLILLYLKCNEARTTITTSSY